MTGRQRGGTLLGLVIGAVLGLSIALAVAVYITNVPVPFTNKTTPHNPNSDEAETLKNRNWNPNAPLAGKNPARPAPSASGELVPEDLQEHPAVTVPDPVVVPERGASKMPRSVAVAPLAPPVAAPAKARSADPLGDLANSLGSSAPVAAPPRAPVRSADPLGELVRARAAEPSGTPARAPAPAVTTAAVSAASASPAKARPPAPTPVVAGTDPFNYFVQAGAFRTPEDAEKQRARLRTLGLQARVTPREQAGQTVYRVRVGPFDKKEEADKTKSWLDNQTVETTLVKVYR